MKPNFVFILADDMGYGDFSALNGGLSSTPALDGLMRESLCLTQHYSGSPICTPSRACLLTGRYPHRTGAIDTLSWRGLDRLDLRELTLAGALRQSGYATGLVGKWHLGHYDRRYHPMNRGFDETVCISGGEQDYYDWRIEVQDDVVRSDGRYLTDVWTEEAVRFIERHAREPFFLYLAYNAPHSPLQAPEEDVKPFAESGRFNKGVSTLYGMLHRMDLGVARVLETLDRLGLRENTVVLFTSDNGPELGGKGDMCLERFNAQFHGSKLHVYEGGIRLPCIVHWPAGLAARGFNAEMVHASDWFPTLLAMAGAEPPNRAALDGIDALPVLRGERGKACTKRFWQWNRYAPRPSCNAAVRDGEWKLVRPAVREMIYPTSENRRPWRRLCMERPEYFVEHGLVTDPAPDFSGLAPAPPELYHLASDPAEAVNLAARHPDLVRRLSTELDNWFESVEAERAALAAS
ncbi:MAG: sulfatase-like hydrolase/transferase [Planctomycetota bacterium]|nr:sulfatase-like hydrolase/transferase [Planctomycetota bacterium]